MKEREKKRELMRNAKSKCNIGTTSTQICSRHQLAGFNHGHLTVKGFYDLLIFSAFYTEPILIVLVSKDAQESTLFNGLFKI